MKVLLRSLRTQQYLADLEQWTDTPEEAKEFGEGREAVIFCYQHHLAEICILGRFPDADRNQTVPLLEIHSV